MNGKPVDMFVYNESGALESKVVGYKCKSLNVEKEIVYVKETHEDILRI